jgi:hypothetical protein
MTSEDKYKNWLSLTLAVIYTDNLSRKPQVYSIILVMLSDSTVSVYKHTKSARVLKSILKLWTYY